VAQGHLPLILQAWRVLVNRRVRWMAAPCCHRVQFPGSSSRRGSNRWLSRTSKSIPSSRQSHFPRIHTIPRF